MSDLPEPLVQAIESLVKTYIAKAQLNLERDPSPPIGWLKGRWELPDSFFDPLPNDMLDLFNGGGEPQ